MLAGYHWWQYGQAVLQAAYMFLFNPLVYLSTGLLIWDALRRGRQQRSFFGFRTNSVWRPLFTLAGLSLLVGIYLSIANLLVGVVIHPAEVWLMSAFVVILGVIRLRYAASIYSVGLFLIAALGARTFAGVTGLSPVDWVLATLRQASIFSWLVVAAGLSLTEWFFFLLRKSGETGPALRGSGRGKAIGAVIVQTSAVMPVIALQPGQLQVHPQLLWQWPLGAVGGHGFSLLAFPLLFGFSGLFAAIRPEHVLRIYRRSLLVLGLLLIADAYLTYHLSPVFSLLGVLLIVAVREGTDWFLNYRENTSDALYPVSPQGVRVLGVTAQSVAQSMGLKPGEVVTRINQVPVHSAYDLHFALDQNPAYAKLEVVDANGELRIVGKPVYTGERNKLGLIVLPDQPGGKVYGRLRYGWLQTLYLKRVALPDGRGDSWTELDSLSISE